ncbi:MAG TPA: DUF5804 family protein [Methanocorpusculum sp.]|nr:DUF5804 family protein [Methanocorpusculum sp.]
MKVQCIAKKDLDLYRILSESETSRHILRFYHPKRTDYGVTLEVSTVSNALSIINEIRWYIMRYMADVLIEDADHHVYITRELAREAYETRSVILTPGWNFEFFVCILENGECIRVPAGVPLPADAVQTFHVWGLLAQQP